MRLARESYFGDELIARTSPSGKGGMGQVLVQLDVVHMKQIKSIIRQQLETEATWSLRQFGQSVSLVAVRHAKL